MAKIRLALEDPREAALRSARPSGGGSYWPSRTSVGLPRPDGQFRLNERFASPDTLFDFFLDIIPDPDFALRQDPRIYERLMRDPQIAACLFVRQSATAGMEWGWVSDSEDPVDRQIADELNQVCRRQALRFPIVLRNFLDCILRGMSVQNVVWTRDDSMGGKIVPAEFWPIFKDRIVFAKDGRPALKTRESPFWGVNVPPRSFIIHVCDVDGGGWTSTESEGYAFYGRGLGERLYYAKMFWDNFHLFVLRGAERFGAPFMEGTYPYGNDQVKTEMLSFLEDMRANGVGVRPADENITTTVHDAKTQMSHLFEVYRRYYEDMVAKTVLGQTLTTSSGDSGSLALARVHFSVFMRHVRYDALALSDTLTRTLGQWYVELNYPGQLRRPPRFEFKIGQETDIQQRVAAYESAAKMGVVPGKKQVRREFGIDEIGPGDEPANGPGQTDGLDLPGIGRLALQRPTGGQQAMQISGGEQQAAGSGENGSFSLTFSSEELAERLFQDLDDEPEEV